jgi:hypothetical protein
MRVRPGRLVGLALGAARGVSRLATLLLPTALLPAFLAATLAATLAAPAATALDLFDDPLGDPDPLTDPLAPLDDLDPGVDPLAPLDDLDDLLDPGLLEPDEPAPPQPAALSRLPGLWLHVAPDGRVEYLEIFALHRFTYRDSAGAAAAGDVFVIGDQRLQLSSRGVLRVFRYRLGPGTLVLLPDVRDAPRPLGDLALMSPRIDRPAIWHRRLVDDLPPQFAPTSEADLLGAYEHRPLPRRHETLTFQPDGRFLFTGPRGLGASGDFRLIDGILELTSGPMQRRLLSGLALTPEGWQLVLHRAPDDVAPPLNDLADLAPSLRSTATYTRPAPPPAPAELTGSYRAESALGTYQLILRAGGEAEVVLPDGQVVPGGWLLAARRLTLYPGRTLNPILARLFQVQPVPDGLVLVRDVDDNPQAGPLLGLPPMTETHARYRTE